MEAGTENKTSARDKILKTTLSIIGEEGFQNITVRKIAAKAGVNIAAVNYYFGSKDNAINEALKYLGDKVMSSFKLLDDNELPPEERIRRFLRNYVESILEHPYVYKNFINQSMNYYEFPLKNNNFLKNEAIIKLKNTLKEIKTELSDEMLNMKILQLLGGLIFPIIIGTQLKCITCMDYYNKNLRENYIEVLLKSLLAE